MMKQSCLVIQCVTMGVKVLVLIKRDQQLEAKKEKLIMSAVIFHQLCHGLILQQTSRKTASSVKRVVKLKDRKTML